MSLNPDELAAARSLLYPVPSTDDLPLLISASADVLPDIYVCLQVHRLAQDPGGATWVGGNETFDAVASVHVHVGQKWHPLPQPVYSHSLLLWNQLYCRYAHVLSVLLVKQHASAVHVGMVVVVWIPMSF